ncbi:endospore germination permease [Paenibacillus sp. GSMTC-2017]|uniref:GerAB/ArcD/ProY family transporter n=1 Tax=Paenibacillus sp. GSMTC-2017 TaxID=2794350 RepID=UPI0018D6EEEA|nr:endospore germination permease [Paenibacillus sp. GSMTC-2017]MBH5316834.1 endospore germination permease [Paenibacillus sp. GSMTC-2017]
MLERGKIGARQLAILACLATIGDSILALPSITATVGKQDAWISAILGLVIGIIIVFLFTFVGKLYPSLTVIEYNEKILGKWLGLCASLLFLFFIFIDASVYVREIGDFMTTMIMPDTPIQYIHVLFIFIVVMGIRLGLEVFTRAGELFFPFFVLLFMLFIIFLAPQAKLENIQPIFEEGIRQVMPGSLASAAYPFMELIVFLMIFPYVNRTDQIRKSMIIGTLLGGIVIILIVMLSILVLGVNFTASHHYPSFELAKKISIGDFLERVEAIMMILWFLSIYFKLAIYFYSFNLGIAQMLRLKEYKFLTLPLGIILLIGSLTLDPNIVYFNQLAKYWPMYDLTYIVGFLVLLLAVYAVRHKKE